MAVSHCRGSLAARCQSSCSRSRRAVWWQTHHSVVGLSLQWQNHSELQPRCTQWQTHNTVADTQHSGCRIRVQWLLRGMLQGLRLREVRVIRPRFTKGTATASAPKAPLASEPPSASVKSSYASGPPPPRARLFEEGRVEGEAADRTIAGARPGRGHALHPQHLLGHRRQKKYLCRPRQLPLRQRQQPAAVRGRSAPRSTQATMQSQPCAGHRCAAAAALWE